VGAVGADDELSTYRFSGIECHLSGGSRVPDFDAESTLNPRLSCYGVEEVRLERGPADHDRAGRPSTRGEERPAFGIDDPCFGDRPAGANDPIEA
jgi:hypothetical protein